MLDEAPLRMTARGFQSLAPIQLYGRKFLNKSLLTGSRRDTEGPEDLVGRHGFCASVTEKKDVEKSSKIPASRGDENEDD